MASPLDGHEFQQTLGDSEGKGSLVRYSSWGCKELDTTEQLNNNNKNNFNTIRKKKKQRWNLVPIPETDLAF